jgi:CBS domain-containing protein
MPLVPLTVVGGGTILADLLAANFLLFLFNLVPAFPLDGGRALRALLSMALPAPNATRATARVGQAFALLLVFVGLMLPNGVGIPLALLALLLFAGAAQEGVASGRALALAGRTARDAMVARFERLAPQQPLEQAALLLLRTTQDDFPVIDAWGRVVGALPRSLLLGALARLGRETPVLQAMDRRVLVVSPEAPLADVVGALQTGAPSPAVVMDGQVVQGIVTLDGAARMAGIVAGLAAPRQAPVPGGDDGTP